MSRYIGIPTSRVSVFKLCQVFVLFPVPTADTVAAGKVNCYNYIVRFHSIPSFREMIGQG